MEKITRTDAPTWLIEKWEQWGHEWKEKHKKGNSFVWRQNKGEGYDDLILKLSLMTQYHCSFCDSYPMGSRISSTIEHFRPKTKFPLLAYQWENLFLSCSLCQEKADDFDEKLLKPDDDDYSFDTYFDINWETGELIPNQDASPENQESARITIEIYRLNKNGKPDDRLEELNKYNDQINIDLWSYRFFIKRGLGIYSK